MKFYLWQKLEMKFGKTQLQIRMNHQLKHTLLTLRQEISFQMRGDFKWKKTKCWGCFWFLFIWIMYWMFDQGVTNFQTKDFIFNVWRSLQSSDMTFYLSLSNYNPDIFDIIFAKLLLLWHLLHILIHQKNEYNEKYHKLTQKSIAFKDKELLTLFHLHTIKRICW